MLGKRMHNSSKNGIFGRSSGKGKDILSKAIASRYNKSQLLDASDIDNSNFTFPYIKPTDNAELLPCYYSVLTRASEEGIQMKDLDQLQLELEKLLSTSALRSRLLCSELEHLDRAEDRHDKKGKFVDKPPSPKHRKMEEKVKISRDFKPAFNKLLKNFQDEIPKLEVPKIIVPKNDTKSKFWLSVDEYCAPISTDDKSFLDDLIEEINKDVDVEICDVGSHYIENWNLEAQSAANVRAGKSKGNPGVVGFFTKKNSYFTGETYPNSIILPLASALLEENVNKKPSCSEKVKDLGMKSLTNGVCIDKRLRNELVELGLLEIEDNQKISGKTNQEDDILREIKLCQKELMQVNQYNIREINRLGHAVNIDLSRQEYLKKLEDVDNKVMTIYNKLLSAPPKERNNLEWEAVKIIKIQKKLHKEAMEITEVFL